VSRRSSDNSPSQPHSSLDLYKHFLEAETAEAIVLNFYRLRLSLGLCPTASGAVEGRYSLMRSKILPICNNYFLGRRLFTSLTKKMGSVSGDGLSKSITVVGAGPVGLRCAIELALFGMKVTVVERYPPDKVATRPNVLKLWKWAYDDLAAIGVATSHMVRPLPLSLSPPLPSPSPPFPSFDRHPSPTRTERETSTFGPTPSRPNSCELHSFLG
jgi:hypothetical protein